MHQHPDYNLILLLGDRVKIRQDDALLVAAVVVWGNTDRATVRILDANNEYKEIDVDKQNIK